MEQFSRLEAVHDVFIHLPKKMKNAVMKRNMSRMSEIDLMQSIVRYRNLKNIVLKCTHAHTVANAPDHMHTQLLMHLITCTHSC